MVLIVGVGLKVWVYLFIRLSVGRNVLCVVFMLKLVVFWRCVVIFGSGELVIVWLVVLVVEVGSFNFCVVVLSFVGVWKLLNFLKVSLLLVSCFDVCLFSVCRFFSFDVVIDIFDCVIRLLISICLEMLSVFCCWMMVCLLEVRMVWLWLSVSIFFVCLISSFCLVLSEVFIVVVIFFWVVLIVFRFLRLLKSC